MNLSGSEILLVEDEPLLRKRLTASMARWKAQVVAVSSLDEARQALKNLSFDFALVDINLPDGQGLDLLRENRFSPNTGVVIMTAEDGVKSAVEAMRLGAGDYLGKPFDHEELPIAFERSRQLKKSARLREHQHKKESKNKELFFFGENLSEVKEQMEKIMLADRRLVEGLPPVLIEGETGTGKTSIARWLHQEGPRAEQPLVEINCSSLPESLAESELFGHEKGAFTDARSTRIGLFEAADGGTLFLDEIPSLSAAIQGKVLTAIEDGKIRRVGGNREISVNVRLIAATNKDLRQLAMSGEFREDLYHRLDLLRLRIPPLRERGGDILRLAKQLLKGLAERYRVEKPVISKAGETRLTHYPWPGNVRELAHELERSIVLGDSRELDFARLHKGAELARDSRHESTPPSDWQEKDWTIPETGFDLEETIDRLIGIALEQTGGNVSSAARLLGVKRDYLRYRLSGKRS